MARTASGARPATGPQRPLLPRALVRTCLLVGALLAGAPAAAQEAPAQPQVQYPGPFEATSRHRALVEAADRAQAEIRALADVQDLELEDMRSQLRELRTLIATVAEVEYMRPDRMVRIRDQAVQIEQRLEDVRVGAVERLEALDRLRMAWSERRDFWQSWREALAGDPRLRAVEADFRGALARTDAVLEQVDAALPDVLAVQQEAATLRAEAQQSAEMVAALRAGRRAAMRQRGEPVLFSRAYFEGLTLGTLREWRPWAAVPIGTLAMFVRDNAMLLVFHIALIFGLVFLARRLRSHSIPEGAWSGLLLRPRALATFGATALLASHYGLAPALWDVVVWGVLAGSGAVLATRLVRGASLRLMVYFFTVTYPLFLLLEALLTPAPVFRLFLAATALAGVALLVSLLRRETARLPSDRWATWSLRLGAVMWFAVLLAEVLGFYLLARWILHATVTTAYVAFVVAFLVVLARGSIGTLVRIEAVGRLSFLRTIGVPVVRQVLRLLQVGLIVVAALYVLDVWELAPSPAETWQRIAGAGFHFAGVDVTLGRILTAAILLYVAIAFSWVMRTFARAEVYPRWELERGVGDSINTLLHYFLITLGFFIALGALGVELRNFAILAGALGIGIGFGLQNIVNNFISGLILLFERPVRVGDTIVIDSDLGTIAKIGLRSTTVLTFDQSEVIVPNGDLISEKVTNWTLTDPVARMIVPVGVAYGSNIARVLEILRETAEAHPDVLEEPPPQPLFTEFGDSALEFQLRVWVQELRLRFVVRSALLAEIDGRFREEGIEIPFPQRDLHVRSVDARIVDAVRAAQRGEGRGPHTGEP